MKQQIAASQSDWLRDTLLDVPDAPHSLADESAWIEVIRRMDSIYADLVRYQVELEEKNARLESANRFIESVIFSMTDVLIVADIHGKIQQVNRALEALIGDSADNLAGRPLSSLFTNDCHELVEEFAARMRSGVISDCNVELVGSDGEPAPIAVNCTPRYDHEGRLSGLVITGRPMGELRRMYQDLQRAHDQLKTTQQQLVQSEKMASLGQLVAGVAHELNNPISVIFGNMHALKHYENRLNQYINTVQQRFTEERSTNTAQADPDSRSSASDTKWQSARSGTVSTADRCYQDLKIDKLMADFGPLIDGSLEGAERVSRIVEDLRRFSTPNQQQAGQFNLCRVIRTAADWVINARRERPSLMLNLPESINVNSYEGYVHQILVNLIQNAADAVEQLQDAVISISAAITDDNVTITVCDNGPGISARDMTRIFDPFYTTKPVGKGTGLGLYISYNLASEQCGGQLSAASKPDQGSVFSLALPKDLPE